MPRRKISPGIVYPPEPAPDNSDLPPDLEADIDRAIAASMTTEPGELPSYMRTTTARQAFQAAFETVGGMPRLAIWANKNYGRFLQLYSRMLPLTLAGDEEHPLRIDAPWLTTQRFSSGLTIVQAQEPQQSLEQPKEPDEP